MNDGGQAVRRSGGRSHPRGWLRTARPAVRLTALFLFAACQPQARRLLLVDLALSDPATLDATATPWHDAGYTVEYRRFYPHLARHDLTRYRTVLLLGGREPEAPSDALTAGDLALLREWVERGGVAVFGYAGDGEGFLDRWTMNRWLASVGAGLLIGDYVLHDSTAGAGGGGGDGPAVWPLPQSPLSEAGYEPFPASRNHVIVAQSARGVLARTSSTAFVQPPGQPPAARPAAAVVAASRVGEGLLVIASRHALSALGPEYRAAREAGPTAIPPRDDVERARAFLVALARWTRRPAEWAGLPPAGRGTPLQLGDAPHPVVPRPPRLEPPPAVTIESLPARPSRGESPNAGPPGWLARQGMRVVWSARARGRTLDSLVTFLEVGGFNALASVAPVYPLADSAAAAPWERDLARATWRQTIERLQPTSLRWLPVIDLRDFRLPRDSLERGPRGDTLSAWCALDARFWTDGPVAAYRTLARLAVGAPELVAGVGFELDLADDAYAVGTGFCDATYRAGLAAIGAARLAAVPAEARYDSLLESGLLGAYYGALERLVAERAAVLRSDALRLRPDMLFAFHATSVPTDWFSLGLLRGFSRADAPLLLWTRERRTRELMGRYRAHGINALAGVGITPGPMGAGAAARLRRSLFADNAGFWLSWDNRGPLPVDSLARLLRRLSR